MIDRKIVKDRILKFSKHLNADEFVLHGRNANWKELLRNSKIPFLSHGGSYQVDFENIDFTGPEIGNQEWRAQLNRYLWLGTCLKEDITGDDDFFAVTAAKTINSFYKFREGIDIPDKEFLWKKLGDNTLSISVRLGKRYGLGWWGTVPFMRESVIDDDFINKMYESTMEQVDFMIKNMTSCGNWRISQLSCLLFLGYIFNNAIWIELASRGLNETFYSQVDEDGCHEEHTLSYHTWMAREFSSFFYLSQRLPELNLNIDLKKLIKMWEYVVISSCPDGQPAGLNDSLRWGYVNKENGMETLRFANTSRENLIRRFTDMPVRTIENLSKHYKGAGQWFIRNDDLQEPQLLIFDATKYGGGHCHYGVNSINFYYGNKMLLMDPGTFNYERSDPFCAYGRQTLSHNTLCIDGMSQLKSSSDEYVCDIDGKCVFVQNAYSSGYSDGNMSTAGTHERLVLWYKDEICIINDAVIGTGESFSANFNFLPGKHTFDGESFSTGFDDYNVLLKPLYSNVELKINKYEGSMEPVAGWLAVDGYKLCGEEKGVAVNIEGRLADFGSVTAYAVIPFKGSNRPDVIMQNKEQLAHDNLEDVKSRIYNKATHYSIYSEGKTYDILSAYLKYRDSRLHPSIGITGPYQSDGKLAFVEIVDEKPVFAYLYDGSYLKYNNEILIEEVEFGNYEKNI